MVKWYMAKGVSDANLMILDIDPSSPTYMRYAGKVTAPSGSFDPWDFAWSECDQMIYGVSGTQVYQMNPVTGVITKFPTTLPGGGSYGAQFMDYNCNLYISNSGNGDVYKASLGSSPSGTITFTLFSGGPFGNYNDATISPVKPTDYGDAPASYGLVYHKFNCAGGGLGGEILYLGSKIDYESAPLYSSDAKGDDNKNTGSNTTTDEDGLVFLIPILALQWHRYFQCNNNYS